MIALAIILAVALLLLLVLVWEFLPFVHAGMRAHAHALTDPEIAERLAPIAAVTVTTNGHAQDSDPQ
jgi:hypothetical protein